MAQFKVGDRVRIVAISRSATPEFRAIIGREGTIVGRYDGGKKFHPWIVRYDGPDSGIANEFGCNQAAFRSRDLAPLTPPAEDAWASEQVRKVTKPQHVEPVAHERPCVVETDALDMERALDRAMRGIGLNGH